MYEFDLYWFYIFIGVINKIDKAKGVYTSMKIITNQGSSFSCYLQLEKVNRDNQ